MWEAQSFKALFKVTEPGVEPGLPIAKSSGLFFGHLVILSEIFYGFLEEGYYADTLHFLFAAALLKSMSTLSVSQFHEF